MSRNVSQTAMPWWRVPAMWLVVLGPALAVAGSFTSLVFALHGGDRPLAEASTQRSPSALPAQQARNHAATHPSR